MSRSNLTSCWAVWLYYVERRRLKSKAKHTNRQRMTVKAFRAIRQFSHTQQLCRHAILHFTNHCMMAAMKAWRDHMQDRSILRIKALAMQEKIMLCLLQKSLITTFASWYHQTKAMGKARNLLGRILLDTLHQSFLNWRDTTIEHKAAKSLLLSQGNVLFVRALTASHEDWLMSKIVLGWRGKAHESKALHWWINGTTTKTFVHWRNHLALKTLRKQLVQRLIIEHMELLLQRVFKGWRGHVHAKMRRKQQHIIALSTMTNYRLCLIFDTWRVMIFHIKTLRGALGSLQNAAMMNQLIFKMHLWRDWASRRVFAKHVVVQMLDKRITKILCIWKSFARVKHVRRSQRKSAEQHFCERKQAQVMASWHHEATKMANLQATLKRCIHHMQNRLAAVTLQNWREKAEHGCRQRQIVARSLYLLSHRAIAMSFLTWRDWSTSKMRTKNKIKFVISRWRKSTLSCTWDAWFAQTIHNNTILKSKFDLMTQKLQKSKLSTTWMAWHSRLKHKKALQSTFLNAMGSLLNTKLRAYFRAWKQRFVENANLKDVMHKALQALFVTRLRAVFWAWARQAKHNPFLREHLRKMLYRLLKARLAMAFTTWREAATTLRRHRNLVSSAVTRLKYQSMSAAWSAWRENITYKFAKVSLLNKALSYMKSKHSSIAFMQWRSYAQGRTQKRTLLGRATSFFFHATLKKAFATLRWYSNMYYRRKVILAGAIARLRFGVLGHAFNTLHTYAYDKCFKRMKMAEVIFFWRTKIVKGAFAKWRHLASLKRELNKKALKLMLASRIHFLSKIFGIWQQHAMWRSHKKNILQQTIARMRFRSLSLAYNSWFVSTNKAKLLRKTAAKFRHTVLWKAWQSLKRYHTFMKVTKAIRYHNETSNRRALLAWKGFVLHSRAKKKALDKAFRKCFGNICMRAMQSWKAHVDLQKILKRGFESYQVKTKRAYLQQWRTCASYRHALVGKFNVFVSRMKTMSLRHCFRSWRIRKAHKHNRQQSVHAAAQVLMHRLLGRTLQAWQHLAQDLEAKRFAFQQKQQALHDAIDFGDKLARRRKRDLMVAMLIAWRLQRNRQRIVDCRFEARRHASIIDAWQRWRQFVSHMVHTSAINDIAFDFARHACKRRLWTIWRLSLKELVKETLENMDIAIQFSDGHLLGHGLSAWIQFMDLQDLRKRKLASAAQLLQLAHQRELISSSFQIWQTALKCALRATSKAESMALQRRMKLIEGVMSVWSAYSHAMSGTTCQEL
ncbi:hypothetical protein COCOBI_02-2180 [Coccomyxa sp. Obi]|nr:hypothetical protein COCOBI_02-2180 [Coccomyxa sp. Obi]